MPELEAKPEALRVVEIMDVSAKMGLAAASSFLACSKLLVGEPLTPQLADCDVKQLLVQACAVCETAMGAGGREGIPKRVRLSVSMGVAGQVRTDLYLVIVKQIIPNLWYLNSTVLNNYVAGSNGPPSL